jgi:hypothetical protein
MTRCRLTNLVFSVLAFSAATLTGCGAVAGTPASALPVHDPVTGLASFGFAHEGGEHPSVAARNDGKWEMAYVGTKLGDRHIYATASLDGSHWDTPQEITKAAYSDQSPCLVKDLSGDLNLFFASNRDGVNWELYRSVFSNGAWQAPKEIPGYTGIAGLALAYNGGHFLLLAQVLAKGLFVSSSVDGSSFGAQSLVAPAGFEPALTFLGDGRALIAYQRAGELFSCVRGLDGVLSAETSIAKSADRLREPALVWNGTQGELLYSDDTADGYRLKSRLFDSTGYFKDGGKLPSLEGELRQPAWAIGPDGTYGLALGMKSDSGQQGIGFIKLPNF